MPATTPAVSKKPCHFCMYYSTEMELRGCRRHSEKNRILKDFENRSLLGTERTRFSGC